MPIKIVEMMKSSEEAIKDIATITVCKINEVAVKEAQYLTLMLNEEYQQDAFLHMLDYTFNKILIETVNLIISTALEMHYDRMEAHSKSD